MTSLKAEIPALEEERADVLRTDPLKENQCG